MRPLEVGELSGATVVPSSFTTAFVHGRSWPGHSKLYSWRAAALAFAVGDTIELHATRSGRLLLWPMMLAEPYIREDRDLTACSLS